MQKTAASRVEKQSLVYRICEQIALLNRHGRSTLRPNILPRVSSALGQGFSGRCQRQEQSRYRTRDQPSFHSHLSLLRVSPAFVKGALTRECPRTVRRLRPKKSGPTLYLDLTAARRFAPMSLS